MQINEAILELKFTKTVTSSCACVFLVHVALKLILALKSGHMNLPKGLKRRNVSMTSLYHHNESY